jgi:DNA-directed RNA polymerase subunit alpha
METTIDLAALLDDPSFNADSIANLMEQAFESQETLHRLLGLMSDLEARAPSAGPTAALKLGVCYLLLADHEKAVAWLQKAGPGALPAYHLGLALRERRHYTEAAARFEEAARQGWDRLDCELQRAETLILAGQPDAAATLLDGLAPRAAGSARFHYVSARLAAERGDLDAAIERLEAALRVDPSHPHALFHLAYLFDLHGSDERAYAMYQECTSLPFVFANALLNLAIIHEDDCDYDKAEACLRRVLAVHPTHARAALYLKDVMAAEEMFIDEAQLKAQEKRDAVLDIPVTDFELSVRSRNCLKKMNINTLGDLLRTTESELLAYKNFGETSLREIKAMLAQKGLSLGQHAGQPAMYEPPPAPADVPAGANPELLARPVMSLDLSVRSRKCLQVHGINTLAELVSKSEEELLASRNFGQTSLKEIQDRLAELGLTLRSPQ